MRWTLLALTLSCLTACGGGGDARPEEVADACTVLGAATQPGALTAGDALQISLEVRFLSVSETLVESLGVDFTVVGTPQPASPAFGGKIEDGETHATPGGVIANILGFDTIVPNGHRPGSFLPTGTLAAPPGLDEALAFVQAPGDDDQCLRILAILRALITSSSEIPAATAIVPQGDLGAGNGMAMTLLDDLQVQNILTAIAQASGQDVIASPTVSVYDKQRAAIVVQREQTSASDLQPIVTSEVYAGAAIDPVYSGVTLLVRPEVLRDENRVLLELDPTAQAVVGSFNGTALVGGNPISIQIPAVIPSTVTTTVSVPSGGTILIGGLKKVADDGKAGVPLLSKIPYINRLFKGTSSAAMSESLMLMVTPRIIIQEESD